MNVLFALYGDLGTNSAIPMALHARELQRRGHQCVAALPSGVEAARALADRPLDVFSHAEVLANPRKVFRDGRAADIVHAWTPRENVRRFVTAYMVGQPTPWLVYLEDNEAWIAQAALSMVGLREDVLLQHSEDVITAWTASGLPHPLRFASFIGLADGAAVIQPKLSRDVPPWVGCTTVMPGVDLAMFAPREVDPHTRRRFGVADDERVIVYPGGLNDFTRPGLEALARAVGLINAQGTPCRLLRSGPVALDFLDRLPAHAVAAITDVGTLPRAELPQLLSLADVFVQPGKPDAFEDLRLPGKLPELFAMGRPVVLPRTNIAEMLADGVDAVFHDSGSAEEIAEKCLALFADRERADRIGLAGRRFAETHFDPAVQASRLEAAYRAAIEAFDGKIAAATWTDDAEETPAPALLARKLRLLAARGGNSGIAAGMLATHAGGIEFGLERARGLETGMAVRDRHIAGLETELAAQRERITGLTNELVASFAQVTSLGQSLYEQEGKVAALQASLSWRITRPFRMLGEILSRLRSRFR